MDLQEVVAINIVVISALAIAATVVQGAWRGNVLWVAVNAAVVITGLVLMQVVPEWSGLLAAMLFVPLVMGPLVLARLSQTRIHQRRMGEAARFARLAAILHPTRQTRLNAAMLQAQSADTVSEQKRALLEIAADSDPGERALIGAVVLRLEGRWEELLAYVEQFPAIRRPLATARIRALGELGHLDRMARLWDDVKSQLHGADLTEAQLFVLAFTGRPSEVAHLLAGPLSGLDADSRSYWLAVAERAAGAADTRWRPVLQGLAAGAATASVRQAASRALAIETGGRPARLDDVSAAIVEGCAQRVGQLPPGDDAGVNPTPVTWLLLGLIAAVYAWSEIRGGSSSLRNLVEMGALFPPLVLERGEWWRLVTALFLHWGGLHAGINGLMLVVLGRQLERSIGSWRMALVYAVGGLASTSFVLWLAAIQFSEPSVLVGASGAIMALFGALVGRTVIAWLRHRDVLDGRNLAMMGVIIVLQTAIDLSMPQVSLAAHASGLVTGLVLGGLLVATATQHEKRFRPG
jgi:rhomboid protease GluP